MSQHADTNTNTNVPSTADEVRAHNAALDDALRDIAASIDPNYLHTDPGDGMWTLAENLAHVAEFSRFFAPELALQLREEGATVGRTVEHPDRNAAIAAAHGRSLEDLRRELDAALAALAAVLVGLRDEHLSRVAQNRKYGPEPLTAFLDRYVLGHKAAHIQQLKETLSRIEGHPPIS